MYFSKGFSSERAGRITVRSPSTTNSTRSPTANPRRLRISCGTVIWPLLLIVLEFLIFTSASYSKDNILYFRNQVQARNLLRTTLLFPPVAAGIRRRFLAGQQACIVNRLPRHRLQRHYSRPGWKR